MAGTFKAPEKVSGLEMDVGLMAISEAERLTAPLLDGVSPRSARAYLANYDRLKETGHRPEDRGANSRRTFGTYRRGLIYGTAHEVAGLAAKARTLAAGSPEWRAAIDELEADLATLAQVLEEYPAGGRDGEPSRWTRPAGGQTRASKKEQRALPKGWRDHLVTAFTSSTKSAYADAVALLDVTGCRNEELVHGVHIRRQGDQLVAVIRGAKVTAANGQPWRALKIEATGPGFRHLMGRLERAGMTAATVSVPSSHRLTDAVTSMSRRLWPTLEKAASPYSFRHAVKADLRAQGLTDAEIAQAMGHAAVSSGQHYGGRIKGSRNRVHLVAVAAARPVRGAAPVVPAAVVEHEPPKVRHAELLTLPAGP